MPKLIERIKLGSTYKDWVSRHIRISGPAGLRSAIGGEFETFGIIEREILRFYGLKQEHYLIDVGCGSGRLAIPLSGYLSGMYLGTDVVPELVESARRSVQRSDWRFEVVKSIQIPEAEARADFICFFSVITHLLHEQSYLYLEEACRVLKPGGRIVLSFLEFKMDFHWPTFEQTILSERAGGTHPLNMFTERVALSAWAHRLGLQTVEFRDGSDAFVPLPHPLNLEDGRIMNELGNLGQSICVFSKPTGREYLQQHHKSRSCENGNLDTLLESQQEPSRSPPG